MMSKRVMGKASFCNVQDLQGGIQCYVARDSIGEESYKGFKKLDIGDIIGIEGEVFKTKTGEISIHAAKIVLLSKSLQILPEKYHGLTNTDTRYRQRYVDLIMNPEVKDTFIKRSRIISKMCIRDRCEEYAKASGGSITLTEDVAEGAKDADVIYTDVWVSMGEPDEVWAERIRVLLPYQVNAKAMSYAKKSAIFMHCLPAFHDLNTKIGKQIYEHFGLDAMEVTDEVFEMCIRNR